MSGEAVLKLSCPDRPGIVALVASTLAIRNVDIRESQQYGDPDTGTFFMRVRVTLPLELSVDALRMVLSTYLSTDSQWSLYDTSIHPRALILATTEGHCVNDLLYRCQSGSLLADIVQVISNRLTLAPLVESFGIPFQHLPVTAETRQQQEAQIKQQIMTLNANVVVLARYMQILSPDLCTFLAERAINIHHSFLPAFTGAKPYRQAHDRGVKLIGATAHYVTADLDEGPIIEQDVARVDHSMTPAALAAVGKDVEAQVLARAVRWHVEHRVFLDGAKTVVFR